MSAPAIEYRELLNTTQNVINWLWSEHRKDMESCFSADDADELRDYVVQISSAIATVNPYSDEKKWGQHLIAEGIHVLEIKDGTVDYDDYLTFVVSEMKAHEMNAI